MDDFDAAGEGGLGFSAADDGEVEFLGIDEGFEDGSSESTGCLGVLAFGKSKM